MAAHTVHLAVTAVTDAGRESLPARTAVVIDGSTYIGARPNPIHTASAAPAAAGTVRVTILYIARNQPGVAAAVQIAERIDGVVNWSAPLATITASRRGVAATVVIDGGWPDRRLVRLAARAVTADDPPAAGAVTAMTPICVRTVGPPAVAYLEGQSVD